MTSSQSAARIAFAIVLASGPWMHTAWPATVNRIVAVVNDEIITQADVSSYADALMDDQSPSLETRSADPHTRQIVLARLIEQRLMVQAAKRAGLTIASSEVQRQVDTLQSQFESAEAFWQSLAATGRTLEQVRERIREQLLVKQVVAAQVRAKVLVSPQEVARELTAHPDEAKPGDRLLIRHLLIRVNDERPESAAQELINRLHDQLAQGAEFGDVATQYSEDQYREQGGRMGWVAQGELLPELDQILGSLRSGQLSAPVRTRLGYHLVKVEDRRAAADLSLVEANRAIYQQLYQEKFQAEFVRWMTDLKRQAYIEVASDELPTTSQSSNHGG